MDDRHEHFIQSLLIASLDWSLVDPYVEELLKKRRIDPIDINLQTYEKDIGIENIRDIQKKILLKPFKSKIKALVLKSQQNITLEAQNALLKILEEPPANTLIIIVLAKKELVLPTIISRCKLITLKEKQGINLTKDDVLEFQGVLNILSEGKIGGKLKLAESIAKNKEQVPVWLQKMVIFTRNKMIEENYNFKYLNLLKELQQAYKDIENTNVSVRTSLENLFLSL